MSETLPIACPSCRVQYRLKLEYAHLNGNCPECGFRIPAPRPELAPIRPLSQKDEPGELLPLEEHWPEPPERVDALHLGATYDLTSTVAVVPSATVAAEPTAGHEVYGFGDEKSHLTTDFVETPGEAPFRFADDPVTKPTTAPALAPGAESPAVSPVAELSPAPSPPAPPAPVDPLFLDGGSARIESQPVATPPAARIPTPEELAAPGRPAKVVKRSKGEAIRPYGVATPPSTGGTAHPPDQAVDGAFAGRNRPAAVDDQYHQFKLSKAELEPEREDPMPEQLFIEGVWNFPWRTANLLPFAWIAVVWTIFLFQMALIAMFAGKGPMGIVISGLVGLGALWVVVIGGGYSGACFLQALTQTAAGLDAVEWPRSGWKEWFFPFMHLVYVLAIATVVTAPLSMISYFGLDIWGYLLSLLLVFPILMLSSSAGVWWKFFDGRVLASLAKRAKSLFHVFILSLFPAAGTAALVYFSLENWVLVPLAGVAVGYFILVYGRLLGRLGWQITEDDTEAKKRKRKKRKKARSGAEADENEPIPSEA